MHSDRGRGGVSAPKRRAAAAPADAGKMRIDLQIVAEMIAPGSRVLDVGCGDGALLRYLIAEKGVDGRGVEIGREGVKACMRRGLSVVQGDADADLKDYPDAAFDYVVLSQTLQATHNPREVLLQLLRIGRRAIVSFPNFGHWRCRAQLALTGRMPVTPTLDNPWYRTPNIHFCTIGDFLALCAAEGIAVERGHALAPDGSLRRLPGFLANLFGDKGVFMLTRAPPPPA